MGKKANVEASTPPSITYSRALTLNAPEQRELRLKHLRALVREATDRGYTDDAPVSITSYGLFSATSGTITVGGVE